MRIAVTGASGFIGGELLAELKKRKDVSVAALTRDASGFEDSEGVDWYSTDYSFESLRDIFRGYGGDGIQNAEHVDAVIHLAGVRGTENDPSKFAVNVYMTDNIVRAMTVSGTQRIVMASTMSVYGDDSFIPWKEDEAPLQSRSCYGDSKACAEQVIKNYEMILRNTSAPLTYGIARIAQVVGEGERRRGMINVFIDTAREHGTLTVMGKSVLKKQYIYVKDLVKALVVLAAGSGGNGSAGDGARFAAYRNITVNIGMRDAYSNLEAAQIINEVFGNETPIRYDDSYPEKGSPFLMDTCRMRNELGIEPLDLRSAIEDMRDSKDNRNKIT